MIVKNQEARALRSLKRRIQKTNWVEVYIYIQEAFLSEHWFLFDVMNGIVSLLTSSAGILTPRHDYRS
jgi:hypothetical protein